MVWVGGWWWGRRKNRSARRKEIIDGRSRSHTCEADGVTCESERAKCSRSTCELGRDAPHACATSEAVVPTQMPAGVNVLHGRAKTEDARRELRLGARGVPIVVRGNGAPDTAARTRLHAWGEDVFKGQLLAKALTQEKTNRQACCGCTLHKEQHVNVCLFTHTQATKEPFSCAARDSTRAQCRVGAGATLSRTAL